MKNEIGVSLEFSDALVTAIMASAQFPPSHK